MEDDNNPTTINRNRRRGLKYSVDEDKAICSAVVMVNDGEGGSAKNTDRYWERIFEKFVASTENREGRNAHGINNRFLVISKEVLKYVSILRMYYKDKTSGFTELDIVRNARQQYESQEKKTFIFEHCFQILQALPRYNPMNNFINDIPTNQKEGGGSNPVTPVAGCNFNMLSEEDQFSQPDNNNTPQLEPLGVVHRPPGMKAQKKAKRTTQPSPSSDSEESAFINLYRESQAKREQQSARHQETMENYVRLKERELDMKSQEEEDRIMTVITDGMSEMQQKYWEQRQQEILYRRGLL